MLGLLFILAYFTPAPTSETGVSAAMILAAGLAFSAVCLIAREVQIERGERLSRETADDH